MSDRAMRYIHGFDGSLEWEEVVVLELGHGDYAVVRQVWSGRSFRVLKKQLMPYDEKRVSR